MRLPSFQMFQQQLLKHSFKCSQEQSASLQVFNLRVRSPMSFLKCCANRATLLKIIP